MKKIIPYGRQEVLQSDIDEVVRTLKSDWLTQGPKAEEFERDFANLTGAKYAVSFSNATAALHIAVQALKRQSGTGKVLTTPITFAASANCALYNGLDVDFVDIDPKTYLLDLNKLEDKLKKNPNAYQGIIPVSFAGYPVQTEELRRLVSRYGLWIVEDACHSPGASYLDTKGGRQASGGAQHTDIGIFSFHPVKHIATGEGGMLTTNDPAVYKRASMLRSHGITKNAADFVAPSHGGWYHEMQELGFNYRMSELHAALGIAQLRRLDENLKKRNDIAARYDDFLSQFDVQTPARGTGVHHAFHLYVIQTEKRAELFEHLKGKGIYAQVHYIPVYWHPYYQKLGFKKGMCPEAERYYQRCLSLPMYHSMSDEDLAYVLENLAGFFKNHPRS